MKSAQSGFSLIELMVAMAIMLLISGAAVTALLKMGTTQATIWNRTQMHSGIRGATEVLQQEVGQAGRTALPNSLTLGGAVSAGSATIAVQCASTCASGTTAVSGIFAGEELTIDAGCADTANPCTSLQEVVAVTAVDTSTNSITATFANHHNSGASVQTFGGFSAGVIPPDNATDPSVSYVNGSTDKILKLFGDINSDGNMVYIEYTCDTTSGNLYRNSMAFDTATKLRATASQILLSNIASNPNGTPCFKYQTQNVVINGVTTYFVTDVAVTLTVNTQVIDPVTKVKQQETKALLNVSPRNVFSAWNLATIGVPDDTTERVQPIPATVTNLLAGTGS
jgi:prepilin-type N-terminal cleavage/methylation domain-containing protein